MNFQSRVYILWSLWLMRLMTEMCSIWHISANCQILYYSEGTATYFWNPCLYNLTISNQSVIIRCVQLFKMNENEVISKTPFERSWLWTVCTQKWTSSKVIMQQQSVIVTVSMKWFINHQKLVTSLMLCPICNISSDHA